MIAAGNEKSAFPAQAQNIFRLLVAQTLPLAVQRVKLGDIVTKAKQIHRGAVFGKTGKNFLADLVVFFRNLLGNRGFLLHGHYIISCRF